MICDTKYSRIHWLHSHGTSRDGPRYPGILSISGSTGSTYMGHPGMVPGIMIPGYPKTTWDKLWQCRTCVNLACSNLASLAHHSQTPWSPWRASSMLQLSLPLLSILSFRVYIHLLSSDLSLFLRLHCFPSLIGLSPLLQSCLSLF